MLTVENATKPEAVYELINFFKDLDEMNKVNALATLQTLHAVQLRIADKNEGGSLNDIPNN